MFTKKSLVYVGSRADCKYPFDPAELVARVNANLRQYLINFTTSTVPAITPQPKKQRLGIYDNLNDKTPLIAVMTGIYALNISRRVEPDIPGRNMVETKLCNIDC